MIKTTTALVILLLAAASCRHHKEIVSNERHADSVATLVAIHAGLLETEEWEQTIILRPDSTGVLVPVEVIVHHHTQTQKETDTTGSTAAVAVTEKEEHHAEQTVQVAPTQASVSLPNRLVLWLALALLIAAVTISLTDQFKHTWKSRNS